MLQGLACERPANRAIAQSGNRIGQTCVDERLGANDAACAARAVHDDACCRARRQFTGAQDQFSTRHAAAAGDVHGLVLVKAASIQHHDIGFLIQQGLDFGGGQRGRVTLGLHQFAKRLAGDVDVDKDFAACIAPTLQAAL